MPDSGDGVLYGNIPTVFYGKKCEENSKKIPTVVEARGCESQHIVLNVGCFRFRIYMAMCTMSQ